MRLLLQADQALYIAPSMRAGVNTASIPTKSTMKCGRT